jgi:cytochrome c5
MWKAMLAVLAFAAAPAFAQGVSQRGVDIYDAVCSGCHANGDKGAPRVGDTVAWYGRASKGLAGLTKSAMEGIRRMPPHGGNTSLSRLELQRAIVYMVNESGGEWVEPADPKQAAGRRSGMQVVGEHCALCHEPGFDGAPRIGDYAAWLPRTVLGINPMVRATVRGHGGMPPRGGKASLTDAELRSAIIYMISSGRARAAAEREKK